MQFTITGYSTALFSTWYFSSRYSPEQIIRRVRELCEQYGINIPVFCILPGKTVFDILKSPPVNN